MPCVMLLCVTVCSLPSYQAESEQISKLLAWEKMESTLNQANDSFVVRFSVLGWICITPFNARLRSICDTAHGGPITAD